MQRATTQYTTHFVVKDFTRFLNRQHTHKQNLYHLKMPNMQLCCWQQVLPDRLCTHRTTTSKTSKDVIIRQKKEEKYFFRQNACSALHSSNSKYRYYFPRVFWIRKKTMHIVCLCTRWFWGTSFKLMLSSVCGTVGGTRYCSVRARKAYMCVCTGFPSFSGTNVLPAVVPGFEYTLQRSIPVWWHGWKICLAIALSLAAYLEQSVALLNRVLLPILV